MRNRIRQRLQTAMAILATAAAAPMLAGCSTELASFDDTYVPQSVEENFPITVVEQPVQMIVEATPGGLHPGDVNEVIRFAQQAAGRATTPVTVGYAAASKEARDAANQAAGIIARQGVSRQSVLVTPHGGRDRKVVLAFGMKTAQTKPCGDWSQNLRGNQFNESGPNFGCSIQQNFAAMVADPNDFVHPKPMTPQQSSSQASALQAYDQGTWTTPVATSSSSTDQSANQND